MYADVATWASSYSHSINRSEQSDYTGLLQSILLVLYRWCNRGFELSVLWDWSLWCRCAAWAAVELLDPEWPAFWPLTKISKNLILRLCQRYYEEKFTKNILIEFFDDPFGTRPKMVSNLWHFRADIVSLFPKFSK